MSDDNLIVAAVWFSCLVAAFFGILFLIYRVRYGKYGRQCKLLDGMRMHRDTAPIDLNPNAPIMSGEQILDYVARDYATPG